MYSKESDVLYNEMCRVVGEMVFSMHDFGIESKQIVIADMLRTALAKNDSERPELLVKAMQASIKTLET